MLVNLTEASRQLGVSKRFLQSRIASGAWPAYRAGRKVIRVSISEILEKMRADQEAGGGRKRVGV